MRRQTQGTSVRSRGPCGAPSASVLLPTVAVVTPLPQRSIRRSRGAVKWCGGDQLGHKLILVGKKGRGGRQGPFYRGLVRRGHKEGPDSLQS
jgi:hypothetical protein